ncbi:MAG: sodium:proton exchanger [Verrucomicrobia bacterium]|nr:sodium:proton exchanger [Verrucomicrobiota bacterium]|tara:strand:- start:58 stop:1380 length:1323 start_codon:yes stop_codon:yes gene_type:complete
MEEISPYVAIIGLSVIILISYFFNVLSRKTNVPSVLMLIVLGILLKQGMNFMGVENGNFLFKSLEILGIIGLIMIVLEAALDLELNKEKWPTIWKSFSVASLSLIISCVICAYLIHFFLIDDLFIAFVYATPLSIISSAIIIPSVTELSEEKKEFMVYDGTFSDILGIMLFYFLIGNAEVESAKLIAFDVFSNIFITIALSFIVSYVLIFVFQKIKTQAKLFLLTAILLILYSVGKLFHLSSLLIILIFGLILSNSRLFVRGFLKKWIDEAKVDVIQKDFHLVTLESAFVVRTFFFVLFGISITLGSLLNFEVMLVSVFILASIYIVRFLLVKLFLGKDIKPIVYLAPRGLITILLFFAIPKEYQDENFNSGILLYTIIVSCIIMAVALVKDGKLRKKDIKLSMQGEHLTQESLAEMKEEESQINVADDDVAADGNSIQT